MSDCGHKAEGSLRSLYVVSDCGNKAEGSLVPLYAAYLMWWNRGEGVGGGGRKLLAEMKWYTVL